MTGKDQRAIARALAFAPIRGSSVELEQADVSAIRESVALHLAGELGFDQEQFLVMVEATRMT